jgi:hypothetical protein
MTTWESLDEMKRCLALMRQGTPYFNWQRENGAYHPCRDVGQLFRFEEGIYTGRNTPALFSIRPDSLTRWGALDFDNHDGSKSREYWLPHARKAFGAIAGRFDEAWLVESSPGGFHIVGISDELVPAVEMRAMFGEWAPSGLGDVEVFPKQDRLTPSTPIGSALRFPGFHQRKKVWSRFIERTGLADVNVSDAKLELWQEPTETERLESLYHRVTSGLIVTAPGQRFNTMKRIVGRLKGRTLDEGEAGWVHDRWFNENSGNIVTPFGESKAEFLKWFRKAAPCNTDIPDNEPTPQQASMIAALPKMKNIRAENLAATVRLILSAKRFADSKGLPEFWLSLRDVADKLGVSVQTASNLMGACRFLKVVHRMEMGRYTEGKASTYRMGKEWEDTM